MDQDNVSLNCHRLLSQLAEEHQRSGLINLQTLDTNLQQLQSKVEVRTFNIIVGDPSLMGADCTWKSELGGFTSAQRSSR